MPYPHLAAASSTFPGHAIILGGSIKGSYAVFGSLAGVDDETGDVCTCAANQGEISRWGMANAAMAANSGLTPVGSQLSIEMPISTTRSTAAPKTGLTARKYEAMEEQPSCTLRSIVCGRA